MMSFCVVPVSALTAAAGSCPAATACSSATTWYRASSHIAVALMVIEVFMVARGMSAKSPRMSPTCEIGTPTLPTSPRDSTWSGSYPVCVGRSKATERPVWPLARLRRYSSLLAAALEWPAYVRMTHAGSLRGRSGSACDIPLKVPAVVAERGVSQPVRGTTAPQPQMYGASSGSRVTSAPSPRNASSKPA